MSVAPDRPAGTRRWFYALVTAGLLLGSSPLIAEALYRDLQATRLRPLFSPTRRPAEAIQDSVTSLTAPADHGPAMALRAIVVGDHRRIAIVQTFGANHSVSVAVGSEIDGWTVDDIQPRSIILSRDARSVTLAMPTPGR